MKKYDEYTNKLLNNEYEPSVREIVAGFLKSSFKDVSIDEAYGDFNNQGYAASKNVISVLLSGGKKITQDFRLVNYSGKYSLVVGSPNTSKSLSYSIESAKDCEMFLKVIKGRLKSKSTRVLTTPAPK